MTSPNDISGLLEHMASKICHDLISPVGAVANGVELLEDSPSLADEDKDAVGLISYSASMATSKLKLYRMAYGVGGRDPNITFRDVHKAFEDMVKPDGKVKQVWDPAGDYGLPDEIPTGLCKMLAGMLILSLEALPKGGEVSVHAEGDGVLCVSVSGDDAGFKDYIRDAMYHTVEEKDLAPRLVHPYVLKIFADSLGFKLSMPEEEMRTHLHLH